MVLQPYQILVSHYQTLCPGVGSLYHIHLPHDSLALLELTRITITTIGQSIPSSPRTGMWFIHNIRGANLDNWVQIKTSTCKYILPVIYQANTQSARFKLDDLTVTATHHQADVISITESWFHDNMEKGAFQIEGFSNPIRNDRNDREGGGVVIWIHNEFQYKVWEELQCEDVETLWLTLW